MFPARKPSTKSPFAEFRHRWKDKINRDVIRKDEKEWVGFMRLI
jgi:hypothetical protein